jgi:hypothetical protein
MESLNLSSPLKSNFNLPSQKNSLPSNTMKWISSQQKPNGDERKMLLWIEWPECGWPSPPEAAIGWWKHGPECFAFQEFENANHLVKFWSEIPEPKIEN